jgi:hypothetical protein
MLAHVITDAGPVALLAPRADQVPESRQDQQAAVGPASALDAQ